MQATLRTLPTGYAPTPRRGSADARYAIYFAPEPDSALAQFGRTWLGYDAETGETVSERQHYGLGPELGARITETPRRYGLHGTLRSPFRLAPGVEVDHLVEALARFTATRPAVALGPLGLSRLGRFLALTPSGDTGAIDRLHTQCVFAFERFRAPLTEAERARRLAAGLTANQKLLLAQWGYPFVLGEYRFHITLTGSLSPYEAARIAPVLAPALKNLQGEVLEVGALCLFADAGDGSPFRLIARMPLAG